MADQITITVTLEGYGLCRLCRRLYKLRRDGTMRAHFRENFVRFTPNLWEVWCAGSRATPLL